jgi:hypothetical protein
MIVRGNPDLGIPSSYDRAQTEKIGYANADIADLCLGRRPRPAHNAVRDDPTADLNHLRVGSEGNIATAPLVK